ncbi:glucokinase [Olivibacter jilunii]|uniref:glucokinase n=1 Tax=Olivibacter jilunii TaxID=985016 RepID=UPI003F15C4FD
MTRIPLYLPNKQNGKNVLLLAADIGGTKTSLGTFKVEDAQIKLLREQTFPSRDYLSFDQILDEYLRNDVNSPPEVLSIGVAGPVVNNAVKLTNLSWNIDAKMLQQNSGWSKVCILNDLEAMAYGLVGIAKDDLATLYSGEPEAGNIAILAPGTGLGEAGLFWDGKFYRPFATEGGHSEFSPRTETDIELFHYLRNESPLISWEHLISGAGIYRIYSFLRDVKGYKEPAWLSEKLTTEDPAAVVSHTAMRELNDGCVKAMQLFVGYMAREATSLVLKLKATGGLYLGGGIPPKIYPLLRDELFRQQFIQSDRMELLLQRIPIHLILKNRTALTGAAYYGAFGKEL